MMLSRGQVGAIGEQLVLTELIARGFFPFVPVVDNGVDIMLLNGNRIQVKTANLSAQMSKGKPTGHYGYQFSLQKTVFGTKEKLQAVGITYENRDYTDEADFLILVGLDDRKFWIVPTLAVKGCSHIVISERQAKNKSNSDRFRFWRKIRDGENNWERLRQSVRSETGDIETGDPVWETLQ